MHNSIALWLRRIGRRLVRPVVAVLIVATLVTTTGPSPAAAVEPFDAPVFSINQSGDIVFAANTLLTCSGTTGNCGDAKNDPGGAALANNQFSMIDVDVDGDPSTYNSSSAEFNLPAGASVTWAGLFWGAVSSAAARNTVEFAAPGSGYQTVTAPAANIYTSGSTYQAFADVTSIVQANGGGSYTNANVSRSTGGGRHAGWTLIVVTDDPNQPCRNLAVFDGFQRVNSGNPVDITVSGFLSPPVGPVNAEIGFVAYEGDDRYTGDYAQLNGTRLGDALSPTTNFFNSRITDGGVYATGGDPNYYDQLGFDAKIIETVGIVPPGQSFRCSIDGLAAGASVEIVITTTSLIDATEVTNTATATGLNGGEGDDGTVVVASTSIARAPVSTIAFTGASTARLIFLAAPLLIMGFLALQMSRRYDGIDDEATNEA